ncbi:MAG TPA: hypothetical protein VNY52_04540 [Solirubrobacteraceae bacterium]|jgi:hypothetical protein|nr:hypothetical protein [Solirubrobacteraceae bacterium]
MNARRLTLTALASLWLTCTFATGAGSALAETSFGGNGSGAGQFEAPQGVAVDQASGDVYAVDGGSGNRVNKFEASGEFLMAWGWGVSDGASEPQSCTTFCLDGRSGPGAGQLSEPQGVAVDNDSLSSSYGDVYVVDAENFRVEKFDSSGKFLLMFGGGVNEATSGDVCVAGEACKRGTPGTADSQFEWAYRRSFIAVGPGGAVYVGDKARVQVFEASGAWKENVSLAGLSSTGKVTALAVDATGDMFVKVGSGNEAGAIAGVREFGPDGTEKSTQFDAGSTTIEAIALDGSGDVFVADSGGGFHVLEYDSSGAMLDSLGANTATFGAFGMAYANASGSTPGELYVSGGHFAVPEDASSIENQVWVLTPPVMGPAVIEPGGVSATPQPRGHASLDATFDPGGFETKYHFEYVDEADFLASGYASASSTPGVSVESSLEDYAASVALTGLMPGRVYHYRIVLNNQEGTVTSTDQTFTEMPAALIAGPWASNVAGTSATLTAEINPLGASTEYELEYGTSTSYGQALSGSAGAGEGNVLISRHLQALSAGTTYHYRVVTHNEVGTTEGPDHTFRTQVASGLGMGLADGRAWELVSPADKHGSIIEPFGRVTLIQAAADGHAITYASLEAIGEGAQGKGLEFPQILSVRQAPGSWSSQDISVPHSLPPKGESSEMANDNPEYRLFSPDLSAAVVQPGLSPSPSLSPEASERTLYLRDDANGSFLPLVTAANVPAGTEFGGTDDREGANTVTFLAASPDLSHVVLQSPYPLTEEATSNLHCGPSTPNCSPDHLRGPENLYEWSAGRLRLVDILPDGHPLQLGVIGQDGAGPDVGAYLGVANTMVAHAISSDGRWVVWHTDASVGGESYKLYVRDMVESRTFQLGGSGARFETMSSDGSRIFFLEGGELYEFDTADGTQTDLTANHGTGESSAGVRDAVLGASENGTYVYFVAKGVLASGGVSGADNLYVLHDDGSEWATRFVATLSSKDEPDWGGTGCGNSACAVERLRVTSRVSPGGRYVAFMSSRPLTGYDNTDAVSAQPDVEVYLYDAVADRLVCASCDPTGARPTGLLDEPGVLVDDVGAWPGQWIAGNLPGWGGDYEWQYQPRYLSDGGRLFFDSAGALVPQDTNGREDVYEFEPESVGSCTGASATFSERTRGCVSLISSGTSAAESGFMDASETGDDVFFVTSSKLTAADYDNSYDVYDAHVCTSAEPCVNAPVSPPECSSGDSCKAAPSPQPTTFGAPASATFSGAGNVTGSPSAAVVTSKSSAAAQKLARALRGCRAKKNKQQRAACERQVRKRYPAKKSDKAKSTKRGNR